jgi:hypothetical protein
VKKNEELKMRKLFFVSVFSILYFASFLPVFADTVAPPCTYKTYSEDKKYVFVMIAPDEKVECMSKDNEAKIEAKKIRNQFLTSGLYKDNESKNPLWTVDWYSHKVYLSSDGKYLARTGPWASSETDEAFSFFNEGKLLKTYKVHDLIRYVSALHHSSSHFEWEKETKLNSAENILEVTTLEGGKFDFKLESGEIINQQKPIIPSLEKSDTVFILMLTIFGFVCAATVLIILGFLLRKKFSVKN